MTGAVSRGFTSTAAPRATVNTFQEKSIEDVSTG